MTTIAFYAPMKPADDPVPSGDRTIARALLAALQGSAIGDIAVFSQLRSRDGKGDAAVQDRILEAAEREIDRLASGPRPDLWLTYHSYYKAPDLIGPRLAGYWRIPYAIVEGTRASSRLSGPYARFARAAEVACDSADVIFYLTDYDREALERDRIDGQRIARLQPFLALEELPALQEKSVSGAICLVACGMFRPGDKIASYTALAAALALVKSPGWSLRIIGDGPARAEIESLFSNLSERTTFVGALDQNGVAAEFARGDLLVWPGVGEAFGMVYLEAQANGCPVLAEDRVGVRDVVRDGGWLVPAGDAVAYARAIDMILADADLRSTTRERGRVAVSADHLLPAARKALLAELTLLLSGSQR